MELTANAIVCCILGSLSSRLSDVGLMMIYIDIENIDVIHALFKLTIDKDIKSSRQRRKFKLNLIDSILP